VVLIHGFSHASQHAYAFRAFFAQFVNALHHGCESASLIKVVAFTCLGTYRLFVGF
jgi:hypothetical protein